MKTNIRKILKFATLLVTSLLIATASAQVYTYMYIKGTVTIGTAKIVWIKGDDAPPDTSISGGTVTIDLDVQPGYPQNFTECLFLKNQDSADHNLTIRVTTSVSSQTFDEFKVHIYKNWTGSWVYVDTLDLTTNDQYETYTNNAPLPAGKYYMLTFEVAAKADTSGSVPFDIEVKYE
jgi:hypothetical protein